MPTLMTDDSETGTAAIEKLPKHIAKKKSTEESVAAVKTTTIGLATTFSSQIPPLQQTPSRIGTINYSLSDNKAAAVVRLQTYNEECLSLSDIASDSENSTVQRMVTSTLDASGKDS